MFYLIVQFNPLCRVNRNIEMTIVMKSEINPWYYPPKFDF